MVKIDDGLDAVGNHFIEVIVIEADGVAVWLSGFEIIDQTRPLNRGSKRVKPRLLHQGYVFFIFTVGFTNVLRTNLLKKTLRLFGKPAVPDRTVRLIGYAFRLRT